MRVRFTASLGLPVLEQETADVLGTISGILIHPDTGRIEGFFVRTQQGFLTQEELLLGSVDILHWGMRITVRSRDVLSPLEERVRLLPIVEDNRTILGQQMVTPSGRRLGRCADVQFSTRDFMLQWLFPRRFWQWKIPIPASSIIEVRKDAVVVKEPAVAERKQEEVSVLSPIPPEPA